MLKSAASGYGERTEYSVLLVKVGLVAAFLRMLWQHISKVSKAHMF